MTRDQKPQCLQIEGGKKKKKNRLTAVYLVERRQEIHLLRFHFSWLNNNDRVGVRRVPLNFQSRANLWRHVTWSLCPQSCAFEPHTSFLQETGLIFNRLTRCNQCQPGMIGFKPCGTDLDLWQSPHWLFGTFSTQLCLES